MFDSLRRALGGKDGDRGAELEAELQRTREAIASREAQLEAKRDSRMSALFPHGPVAGSGEGRYPGLDPMNFEEAEPESWLVAAATGIIDNFPGSEALLSQLDATFLGFSEANHYRVVEDGPYAELSAWQREIFNTWDLPREVPVFLANQGKSEVLGCSQPFVVLGRQQLDLLEPAEQRFLLATCLGHVFFGNLRIFAFYRLMEMLDKLPSMTGLITRGLGMIPVLGNTVSRGIELARLLNNQVIRKTNLVVGRRQHVLCDRLALLAGGGELEPAQRYFARVALGGSHALELAETGLLLTQGEHVHRRFEAGEIDLAMLSVVGPTSSFAAFRAYKLDAWAKGERSAKIAQGYYVTRSRLQEYRETHKAVEEDIDYLETRLLELHNRAEKLEGELARHAAGQAGAAGEAVDAEA